MDPRHGTVASIGPRRRARRDRTAEGQLMTNSTIAKIALTAAVALAGVGFLVVSSRENSQHYQMVDELMASGDLAQWDGKEMKVHGWVEAGSIVEKTVNQ